MDHDRKMIAAIARQPSRGMYVFPDPDDDLDTENVCMEWKNGDGTGYCLEISRDEVSLREVPGVFVKGCVVRKMVWKRVPEPTAGVEE